MIVRIAVLGLILAGCEPPAVVDSAAPSSAIVLDWARIVRPGGTFWLTTVGPGAGRLAMSVDGRPIGGSEREGDLDATWTVVELPPDLPLGTATVTITGRAGAVEALAVDVVAPIFVDVAEEIGLVHVHDVAGWPSRCARSLTGVGFADVDLDGDPDAYVGNVGAGGRFWRNDGDGDGLPTFTDATAEVGLAGHDRVASVSFADYDDDGDPDLLIGRRGANALLRNRVVPDGVLAFEDVTAEVGIVGVARTTGAGWGDYDNDGDLDLYVVNHAWCYPDADPSIDHRNADQLYRNDDGVFVDVTALLPDTTGQVGDRFGFAAIWVDHDRDHDQDLFVFADHVSGGGGGVLFRNDGPSAEGWRFTDATAASGFAVGPDAFGKPINAMGGAIADVNHDGSPDLAFTNIGPNLLQLSSRRGEDVVFADVAAAVGVQRALLPWEATSITWAPHLFDADNDGDVDLLWVGGDLRGDAPQPHAFFADRGDGVFEDRTWAAGLDSARAGKASALVDLDGDGFLELVVANWADRLEVYRNTTPDRLVNHWLAIDLEGDGARVARDAFGAIVEVTVGGEVRTCFRTPNPSMSAAGDAACRFGLGAHTAVDAVRVIWPNGEVEDVEVGAIDRRVRVVLE